MTKIFLAGASGYIGGDFLHTLTTAATAVDNRQDNEEPSATEQTQQSKQHYEISALVRSSEAAHKIKATFPSVRVVRGELENAELVENEVKGADVVINVASVRNLTAAKNIHRGLTKSTTGRPVYWIQISGASVLAQSDLEADRYGESSDLIFHDDDNDDNDDEAGQEKTLKGTNALYHLIKGYPGREVENYVLDAGEKGSSSKLPTENSNVSVEEGQRLTPPPEEQKEDKEDEEGQETQHQQHKEPVQIHTALLLAPTVHGVGRGPVKKRSLQLPELCRVALERESKRPFRVGKGQNRWGNVWIGDLSGLLAGLVKKAAEMGLQEDEQKELWGRKGIYLAGVGEMDFASLAELVADEMARQGYIPSYSSSLSAEEKVDELDLAGAEKLSPGLGIYFGINARNQGRKGRRLLGWDPSLNSHSLKESVEEVLAFEAELRGVVPASPAAATTTVGKVENAGEAQTETGKVQQPVGGVAHTSSTTVRKGSRRRSLIIKSRSVVNVLRARLGDMLFRR